MTTSIDYRFTTIAGKARVKEAIKEFKTQYTETDLMAIFAGETGNHCAGEILKCNVEGFNNDFASDKVTFSVDMIIFDMCKFYNIRFYMNEVEHNIWELNQDEILQTYEIFRKI